MRFQFLKPRRDVASAEQVRALREQRGWTVEQLADEVRASSLEVSAWEAGTVRVPADQALNIRWHTEQIAWDEALDAARGELCDWARENAPDEYERILRNPGRLRDDENAPARAHLTECGACQTALARARQIGGYPSKPLEGDTFRARYWRWVGRLPDWVATPFIWAGLAFPIIVSTGLIVLTVDREAGFWTHAIGLVVGAVFAELAELLPIVALVALSRVRRGPVVALLRGCAFGAGGLLGWSLVDPLIDVGDPRHWAAAMAVGCGMQLFEWVVGRLWGRRRAKALKAGATSRVALSPGPPDLAASLERGAPASRQPARP